MKMLKVVLVLVTALAGMATGGGLEGSFWATAAAETVDSAMIRAREREQAGDLQGAIRILERATAGNMQEVEAGNQLGLLYAKAGEFGRAGGMFRGVLSRDPENLFARLWLGITHLAEEDLEGAFRAFHGLAQIRPESDEQRTFLANAYYYLGAIYSFRGDRANALKALEAARRANPRDAETRYRLGALYHDLGQMAEAEAEYREALRLNERHVKALNALGWFYYNRGRQEEARKMWERTLRFSPQNNEARDSLAKFYNDAALKALEAGRKEEAKRLWRRVFQYDPKNRAATYYLKKHR